MMKRKRLLLIFLFLNCFTLLNAQFEKGDFSFHLSPSYGFNTDEQLEDINRFNGQAFLSWHWMSHSRWMMGVDLFHLDGAITYFQGAGYALSPLHQLELGYQLRYYWRNQRLASYVFLTNRFGTRLHGDVRVGNTGTAFRQIEDTFGYMASMGGGINYFFNSNFALEGELGVQPFEIGAHFNGQRSVSLNLGLRFFFKEKWPELTENLSEWVLRQGNLQLGASNISWNQAFESSAVSSFWVRPQLSYFLTNRLKVRAGVAYTHYDFPTNNQDIVSFNLGPEYYFALGENFFVHPSIRVAYSVDGASLGSLNAERWALPISLDWSYFQGCMHYLIGTAYEPAWSGPTAWATFDLYGRCHYYLSEAAFINAGLNFIAWRDNRSGESPDFIPGGFDRVNLSFGFGFWLNVKKME